MSQALRPERVKQAKDDRTTTAVIAVVIVVSVLLGLFALPRLGPRPALSGVQAPEFSLPIVAGGDTESRISLGAYRGRVVVLDFFATWCAPCAEQASILERFVSVPRSSVVVVGVDEGEDVQVVRGLFDKHTAMYPILADRDEQVGRAYSVRSLPTVVVIDPQGKISAAISGVIPYARLERLVADAAEGR